MVLTSQHRQSPQAVSDPCSDGDEQHVPEIDGEARERKTGKAGEVRPRCSVDGASLLKLQFGMHCAGVHIEGAW